MSEILLVMPSYINIYGKIDVNRIGFILPSLGLAYIASFLKAHGREVELIDANCNSESLKHLLKRISDERPRFVGFTVVTANMSSVVNMAGKIKEVSPQTKIIVGGPHPSALPNETMQYRDIDIVVRGEGEFAMLEICRSEKLSAINGICYKDEGGKIISTPMRPLIEDLDSLPFPLFEQLPVHRYGYLSLGNVIPVLSGRGCPYNCSFCASGIINQRRCRFRSVKNFVDEIGHWIKFFKINKFVFCDESFTFNLKRTNEICDEIIRRNLDIGWSCMMRADNTNEETFKLMKRAGCKMIEIGIESADENVLEKSNKKIELSRVVETVRLANNAKLEINAFFILGLPFDSPESINRTINFSKKLKIDYAQFSMFTPLPGSDSWDLVKEGGPLRCIAKDWADFSRYKKPIVTSDRLSNEMLYSLYQKAVKDFYLRPYMFWRTLKKIDSYEKLRNFWNSGAAMLKILAKD